jgi:hypothetical protein
VQSVSESYGNFVRTLTAQPLDGSTFDAYGYTIDLVDGILTRRVSGQVGVFTPGPAQRPRVLHSRPHRGR